MGELVGGDELVGERGAEGSGLYRPSECGEGPREHGRVTGATARFVAPPFLVPGLSTVRVFVRRVQTCLEVAGPHLRTADISSFGCLRPIL